MKVLVTGAFGNIGESTILALLKRDHEILCFDLKTNKNEQKRKMLLKLGEFETFWGDISDQTILSEIVKEKECIIHLAAIIAPTSEKVPDLTRKVNVEGTQNILDAAVKMKNNPKFIFASSVSIYGPRMNCSPPRIATEELSPTDCYTHSKVEAEELVKKSDLPWTILRLAVVPPLEISLDFNDIIFEIPLDQRIEFVHTRDVGVAIANSVNANTAYKILLIGGGRSCQMLAREFFAGVFETAGIGMFPDSAFKVPKTDRDWYYTDWMDTSEAQELLKFQSLTYMDYLEDYKKNLGFKRYFAKIFGSYIQRTLLKKSPYYKLQ